MSCPFVHSDLQASGADPNEFEIEVNCPMNYVTDLSEKYLHPSLSEKENQNLLSKFPVYLKNTLSHPIQIQKLRKINPIEKIVPFMDFQREGSKFYHKEEFEKAIECYEHCYGMYKYLEIIPSGHYLSESDIHVIVSETKTSEELKIRDSAIITILYRLILAFVKLRYFSEAMAATNEGLEIDPDHAGLKVARAKIRLCNIRDNRMDLALEDIEKAISLKKGYEKVLIQYKETLNYREKIFEDIILRIAKSYFKLNWGCNSEVSVHKEIEHVILERMEGKYYDMIGFYLVNGKFGNLARVRDEMRRLQMVVFKMDFAFALEPDNQQLIEAIKSCSDKKEQEIISRPRLDLVKRSCITMLFTEEKFNNQLLSYCMHKCTEEEKVKNHSPKPNFCLSLFSFPCIMIIIAIAICIFFS